MFCKMTVRGSRRRSLSHVERPIASCHDHAGRQKRSPCDLAGTCRRSRSGCVAVALLVVSVVLVNVWMASGWRQGRATTQGQGASQVQRPVRSTRDWTQWPPVAPVTPFGVPPSFKDTAGRTLVLMVVDDASRDLGRAVQRGSFYARCGFRVAVAYGLCRCGGAAHKGTTFCPSSPTDVHQVAVLPLPCSDSVGAVDGTEIELQALRWASGATVAPDVYVPVSG